MEHSQLMGEEAFEDSSGGCEFSIPCSTPPKWIVEWANIGKGPVIPVHQSVRQSSHQSICQSVLEHSYMKAGWIFFILGAMIRYQHWVAHVCKIEFGSVSNLSNYGYFFINFECCDISEKNECACSKFKHRVFHFPDTFYYHSCTNYLSCKWVN